MEKEKNEIKAMTAEPVEKVLPATLEKDEDWDKWEAYLMNAPKEELVDFLLGRMAVDMHFMNLIYGKFAEKDVEGMETFMQAFDTEFAYEMQNSTPDAEYMVSLTRRFVMMASERTIDEQKRLWRHLITKLEYALSKDVGKETDDTDLLEDLIDELEKKLVA